MAVFETAQAINEVDHTPCIEALENLRREMDAAIERANKQIADTEARLEQLDRTNAALARTQIEMLRQVRHLLEIGRVSDALRYVNALCDSVGVPSAK